MNLSRPLLGPLRRIYRHGHTVRRLLPKQRCRTFGPYSANEPPRVGRIYVMNLDRQPARLRELNRELCEVLDSSGAQITELTVRHPAVDASSFVKAPVADDEVDPFYTLRDQLFVEPQPRALPDRFQLDQPIQMSRVEVAVARSHIGVWRQIAAGEQEYALVLEDDVWFPRRFARYMDRAWSEMEAEDGGAPGFDMLYLSYSEVKNGAQKALLSSSVFRPVRGLWFLSGYVFSRAGARRLLESLPCRGPVDLWVNHRFQALDVRATRRPIISQRHDVSSTNSYSILPVLTRIGVLDGGGESLFKIRPQERPVFAFGAEKSGLSSLAMALSMLGYRCCSDLQDLPSGELGKLLAGRDGRLFDAYVNIGSLEASVRTLRERYGSAKFIVLTSHARNQGAAKLVDSLKGCDLAVLHSDRRPALGRPRQVEGGLPAPALSAARLFLPRGRGPRAEISRGCARRSAAGRGRQEAQARRVALGR